MTHQGSLNQKKSTMFGKSFWKNTTTALYFSASLSAILMLHLGVKTPITIAASASGNTLEIAQASSTVIYVNPQTGSDRIGAGNSTSNAYRTISYALQQAQAGTVIQLAPGTYTRDTGETFPLVVPAGVTLRGDEATKGQTVIILGGGTTISPTFASQNVAIRAEQDSQIRGLTISNPNTRGTGLWIESTNPIVSNNTFSNSERDGVFVTGNGTPLISDNIFTKNNGNGISLASSAKGEIRNNLFQNTGFGLAIGGNTSSLITGNRVTQNVDGMVISNAAQPVLRNNVIETNQRDGIVAISNAAPNLGTADSPGNNIIRNNGRNDLYNATTSNTIVAVGNDINKSKIIGRVDFVAAQVQPPDGGTPSTSGLTDVKGNWAEAYITALSSKGIIAGFPDGTFRPNDPVTRAQFAAIINKAFAPAKIQSCSNFGDVATNFWGFQAIQTSCQGGFLSGYPNNIFQPNQNIPRLQVLVALVSGLKLRTTDTTVLSVFSDAAQIPSWATTAIAGATKSQLVVNYPQRNLLNPNRNATRAEVAAFVYQSLVNSGKVTAIPSPYLVTSP